MAAAGERMAGIAWPEVIEAAVAAVPDEWLGDDLGSSSAARRAYREFLGARVAARSNVISKSLTVASAEADLRAALAFGPPHLSWYQLTIEPNTVFHKRPPLLPVEEDGRLHDPKLRENFIEILFTLKRWRKSLENGRTAGNLVDYHSLVSDLHRPPANGWNSCRWKPGSSPCGRPSTG